MNVALVVMPYHSAQYGSIQCGLLKSYLRRAGIGADILYFNLPFARRIGLPYYETLAHATEPFLPEWSFAQTFIGRKPEAVREVRARLRKLKDRRGFDPRLYWRLVAEAEPFLDECVEEADWGKYDLVGFSSVFQNQLASLALARKIKSRHPNLPIVFGGPNVEGPMGRALLRAFPFVDYVVDGEGEEALRRLCESLRGPEPGRVPGVVRREEGLVCPPPARSAAVPLDELPFPDYDDYFEQVERRGLGGRIDPHLYFESSRGCWWGERQHCTFCGLNPETIAYRSKSGGRLLEEIDYLARRHKVCQLNATDNILDLKYLDTLFPALKSRVQDQGINLNFFYETKSNLKRQQVRQLRESGVGRLQPGIESLSTEILRMMRKGVTAIQNVQMLRACGEFRVDANWILIYGFPREEARHHEEMLALLPHLAHLQPPDVAQRWLLDRFSPYFSEPEKWGIKVLGPKVDYRLFYPEGADIHDFAYRFDYDCPLAPAEGQETLEALKDFVRRWQEGLGAAAFFHYMKGPGFVRLYDYRPRHHAVEAPSFRSLQLTDWRAEVYCLCVDVRGVGEILDHCRRTLGLELEKTVLEEQLAEWSREGLGMLEDSRFLSLALPMPADPMKFLERCQMLWAVHADDFSVRSQVESRRAGRTPRRASVSDAASSSGQAATTVP
jgi:ribosomal peptide maturation radical SAM protein 1